MSRILALLTLALAVLVGACKDNLPPQNPSVPDFAGVDWRLESIESNGRVDRIEPSAVVTISFDAATSTFTGSGPCNEHSGRYVIDNAAMSVRDFIADDEGCAYGDLEGRYFAALKDVRSYLSTATSLKLYAAGGGIVLNYLRMTDPVIDNDTSSRPVRGKVWRLVKVVESSRSDTVVQQPPVTLIFEEGRRISGTGPCNAYWAYVEIDSAKRTLAVRDLTSTEMACARSELEGRYFAHLLEALRFRATDSTLVIVTRRARLYYVRLDDDPRRNAPILDKEWRLRSITAAGRMEQVATEHGISLVFKSPNSFIGFGACNRYNGEYRATIDGDLTIERLDEPGVPCPDREVEGRYFSLLRNATDYWSSDNALRIATRNGAMLHYELVRAGDTRAPVADTMLAGSLWKLQSIVTRNGLETPPSLTTLSFGPRKLQGHGPCNSYEASYTASGQFITIKDVTASDTACEGREFERQYLEALPAAREYEIDAERLVIVTAEAILNYVRQR